MLDAAGQGESPAACRRLERLAQAQGDLCGDHVAAEATRRRVLEAREHAASASTRGEVTGAVEGDFSAPLPRRAPSLSRRGGGGGARVEPR